MDVRELLDLGDDLKAFVGEFHDCFSRSDTRQHLTTYVHGQLSPLDAKSVEPIALHAGVPVRTLQEFLSQHRWNEDAVRSRVRDMVIRDHSGPHAIAIFDETSDVKKGEKTPGVQRQWCGKVGKTENCMVTVHLAYAQEDFHCLLDGELFLPESWSNDRARCREAGIPENMVYRPKWQIALELYDRAVAGGVQFAWATADEGYGSKPGFLEGLYQRNQRYVVEVPRNAMVFPRAPKVTNRARYGGGRPRKTPRIVSGELPARSVEQFFWFDETAKATRWRKFHIKDSHKGPIVWEAKRMRVVLQREDGLPGAEVWLIVARNLQDPSEIKYFVSNAPVHEHLETLLLVAFSRWRVERAFEDHKQEIGLDCWEGRRYVGIKRHLILSSVSYLFLAKSRERLREKKSGDHHPPATAGNQRASAKLVGLGPSPPHATRTMRRSAGLLAAPQSRGPRLPSPAGDATPCQARHLLETTQTMHVAAHLAL
jgi:SRSO17 transposase